MRITKYRTLQNEGIPYLVKEKSTNYGEYTNCDNPEKITHMLNAVFDLEHQTEEYMYLICMDVKSKILGVFELSHGSIDCTCCSPREVFQKAFLCGASSIISAHNHPSGSTNLSTADFNTTNAMVHAGKIMQIPLADHIIVGRHEEYYSFKENNLLLD